MDEATLVALAAGIGGALTAAGAVVRGVWQSKTEEKQAEAAIKERSGMVDTSDAALTWTNAWKLFERQDTAMESLREEIKTLHREHILLREEFDTSRARITELERENRVLIVQVTELTTENATLKIKVSELQLKQIRSGPQGIQGIQGIQGVQGEHGAPTG